MRNDKQLPLKHDPEVSSLVMHGEPSSRAGPQKHTPSRQIGVRWQSFCTHEMALQLCDVIGCVVVEARRGWLVVVCTVLGRVSGVFLVVVVRRVVEGA